MYTYIYIYIYIYNAALFGENEGFSDGGNDVHACIVYIYTNMFICVHVCLLACLHATGSWEGSWRMRIDIMTRMQIDMYTICVYVSLSLSLCLYLSIYIYIYTDRQIDR